ncbi:MAG: hypothetical protein ACYTGN_14455 [Planctomycetota bacterium]
MKRPRVRFGLLLLLWVWAGCVFLTLDLFLNIEEFGGVRPRARLYRGMRVAAHRMVGEPYLEHEESPVQAQRAPRRRVDREDRSPGSLPGTDQGGLAEEGKAAAAQAARLHAEEPERARDLARAALEAQAEQLAREPSRLDARAWRAARVTLERIAWVMPRYADEPEHATQLNMMRAAVDERLAACDPVTVTEADVEAMAVASHVADEGTAGLCVRWLRAVRFAARTREEHLACHAALRIVASKGSVHHRNEIEALLAEATQLARDPERQRLLDDYRTLVRRRGTDH